MALFSHHDLAAKLGEQFGADWVIVGQHSNPSFLFSKAVHLNLEHNGITQHYFSKAIRLNQNRQALSRSEQKILTLLVDDKSAVEVASELNLSHKAVENHRQKILRKMGVKKFSELSKSATIWQTLTGLGKLHKSRSM